MLHRILLSILIVLLVLAGLQAQAPDKDRSLLFTPDDAAMNQRAPEVMHVRLETTKGIIRLELHRSWSPHGVDRFYNLVRHGFYDQAPVFRVRAGMWAQFGINGEPKIAQLWRDRTIPDDPRVESNVRGTVAFAFKDPNGRTTQLFINLRDNSATHDKEPFVPIAKIVAGMDVADALYSGYGEQSGGGIRGGKQDPLFEGGNKFLKENFPLLDYILKASVEQ
ncbi:MAG TPA: peptidylprolyl isomerase [Pyrinomonadaceae bacterium]|nr:peptidylprolyl isomerase [Pyrinomonadaceae bacterium]